MKQTNKSLCCHAPVTIEGHETHFYLCTSCENSCDLCDDDNHCHCEKDYPEPEHGDKCLNCGGEII